MATRTPLYKLADALLKAQGKEGGVHDWVYERRMRLQPKPWGAIAAELARVTGGDVAVSSVALREWFAEEMAAERVRDPDASEEDPDHRSATGTQGRAPCCRGL